MVAIKPLQLYNSNNDKLFGYIFSQIYIIDVDIVFLIYLKCSQTLYVYTCTGIHILIVVTPVNSL